MYYSHNLPGDVRLFCPLCPCLSKQLCFTLECLDKVDEYVQLLDSFSRLNLKEKWRSCRVSAVNTLTKVGLKGGATCCCSRAFQSVLLKKLCRLMSPFTPRRSSGSLTNSCGTNKHTRAYRQHVTASEMHHQHVILHHISMNQQTVLHC